MGLTPVCLDAVCAAFLACDKLDPFGSGEVDREVHHFCFDRGDTGIAHSIIEHAMGITPSSYVVFVVAVVVMDDRGLKVGTLIRLADDGLRPFGY